MIPGAELRLSRPADAGAPRPIRHALGAFLAALDGRDDVDARPRAVAGQPGQVIAGLVHARAAAGVDRYVHYRFR